MDNRKDLREFLASRRAKVTPAAGRPAHYGGHRRVPGLRREEVALLAGVSVEYYTRLERGNAQGVSDSVLEALVRALQLDEAERAHLFDLVRAANAAAAHAAAGPPSSGSGPGVQQLLDAMTDVPAFVQNGRLDVLAANTLGRALYADLFDERPDARPADRRTTPASPSSTRGPLTSTPTGTAPPPTASRCSAPRPAATPTTGCSPSSSAS